jgi:hypothetical protein
MNLRARIKRLERLQHLDSGRISIDVIDRVVNGTISKDEFERWMPFWEKILANSRTTVRDASDRSLD